MTYASKTTFCLNDLKILRPNIINREHYRYLCDKAKNGRCFVAIVLPSSGLIWKKKQCTGSFKLKAKNATECVTDLD